MFMHESEWQFDEISNSVRMNTPWKVCKAIPLWCRCTHTARKRDRDRDRYNKYTERNGNLCCYLSLCSMNTLIQFYTTQFYFCLGIGIGVGVGQWKHTVSKLSVKNYSLKDQPLVNKAVKIRDAGMQVRTLKNDRFIVTLLPSIHTLQQWANLGYMIADERDIFTHRCCGLRMFQSVYWIIPQVPFKCLRTLTQRNRYCATEVQ